MKTTTSGRRGLLVGCWLLLFLALLAGCGPRPVGLPPSAREPVRPEAAPLLESARQALARGELHQAESFLERAIRLEPRNGLLWHTLAETKYRQGDYNQTVQLCLRAGTYLSPADPLVRTNDQLLSRAYQRLGRTEQAREAAERAIR